MVGYCMPCPGLLGSQTEPAAGLGMAICRVWYDILGGLLMGLTPSRNCKCIHRAGTARGIVALVVLVIALASVSVAPASQPWTILVKLRWRVTPLEFKLYVAR